MKKVWIALAVITLLGGGFLLINSNAGNDETTKTSTNKQSQPEPQSNAPDATPERVVTQSELSAANGKDGKDCYVAVDGTVYQIKDFALWSNGKHTTSGGQAFCGADMSEVIGKSPHGRSKLNELIVIGKLD